MARSQKQLLKVRQVRSRIGRPPAQRQVLDSLGLRHPGQTVERPDTPAVRGMVAKIPHLVEIVEE